MKLNLLTLKFSENSSKLEAPFLSDYYRVSLPHIRISLVLGALLYSAFGILDAVLMPEHKLTIWFIRFIIVCPVICGTLMVTFSKSFERYMQSLLAGVYVIAGAGIICMIVIAPPPINYSYYAGLLLVFMWGYTFIRIRFLWASLAGWVQVILYEIAAIWISPTPFSVLLNNNFFFISANIIGMMACYSIEFYARRDFFLRQQLEIEREKVSKINQDLEERVEKRTADYLIINQALEQEITGHKQAVQALQQSEERYRTLVENASDIVFRTDSTGHFTFINPAGMRIAGYEEEVIIGMHYPALIHPRMLDETIKFFSRQFLKNLPDTYLEYAIITKDGREVWLGQNTQLIMEDGNLTGFQAVSRDITARKQAEESQRILEERLQQADKMEAIGTLAGGIAHDFNNLLMGIQGYASMTLLNLDTANPNYERLKRIEQQVQSGADLTSQLLGFARGGRYEVKPTNMNEIIQKTSSLFGRTKKEIAINRKLANDLCNVEVDRGQMEQVFLNLYVNAWQAMPGGGDIYLETRNVILNDEQVLPFCGKPGKHVEITITDTGTGMDEKTKEKIFEPFFTTKEMGRGTGLGLATVYGIIKGHQGMISVESEPGQGTIFTIYLPASDKEVVQEKRATEEIITGTETILLIDDEQMVMEVNQELLESMGYTVYAAGSGQEGIALYTEKKEKIDLVILDMVMPGISGSETFDRLRKINPKVKVLLSSGYSLTGEAQAIMDRGCNGFLQKPFKLEELSGKVRAMLIKDKY
jgi:two-component system cell cycle sensor histidine kinase/response regulator CckA